MAEPALGIYIHWPFCARKCPYCDFNSHVRRTVDEERWLAACLARLDIEARATAGRAVGSVFFGGGTPSLMAPASVGALLDRIATLWPMAAAEITLEANPSSVEAGRFAGYAAAGVNRVSVGVQALDDAALAFLGRLHGTAEALAAVAMAQRHFANVSLDLIYARPGQTPDAWSAELTRALALGTQHLSLYQLTIEPQTPFHALAAAGALTVPADDAAAELYRVTQTLCEAAGRPAYEVSNHAAPGHASRHNLVYWRMGDYLGIGPGAHGRRRTPRGVVATMAVRAPLSWVLAVERGESGHADIETIAPADQAREMLLMGMRLAEGVCGARLARLTGHGIAQGTVAALVADGLLRPYTGALRVTDRGRLLLNAVIAALADGLYERPAEYASLEVKPLGAASMT